MEDFHVILLILENRSFDQIFGYRQALEELKVDGIDFNHLKHNVNRDGQKIYQQPIKAFTGYDDTSHDLNATLTMINGTGKKMSGFVLANELNIKDPTNGETSEPIKDKDIMGYFERGSFPILDLLADNFVVCDKWFASAPTCTLPNRAFGLCGQSDGHIDNKGKFNSKLVYTCDTIFDRLNEGNKDWKVYYNDVGSSLVFEHQLRFKNLQNYFSFDQFETDVRNNSLPNFCFIEPEYGIESSNKKIKDIMNGQNLIVSILNSLQSNKEIWNKSLFVIYYDECGGFYDHVYPPKAISPNLYYNTDSTYDFNQYGIRVPALLVSPLLDPGVDNTLYDHTSVLKFMETIWNLRELTYRDKTANHFLHLFRKEPRDIKLDLSQFEITSMNDTSIRNRNQADKEFFSKFWKRRLMKFISGFARTTMKITQILQKFYLF